MLPTLRFVKTALKICRLRLKVSWLDWRLMSMCQAFSCNSQTKIFLSCTNTIENKASMSINNTYLDVHISRHVTYSSESTVSTTVQSCLPCCLCTAVSLLAEVRADAVCCSWCHIFTWLYKYTTVYYWIVTQKGNVLRSIFSEHRNNNSFGINSRVEWCNLKYICIGGDAWST